jgi:hypothetical protein
MITKAGQAWSRAAQAAAKLEKAKAQAVAAEQELRCAVAALERHRESALVIDEQGNTVEVGSLDAITRDDAWENLLHTSPVLCDLGTIAKTPIGGGMHFALILSQ